MGGWSAEDRRELDEARLRDLSALEGWAEQLGAMAQDRPDTKMLESKPAPAIVNVAGEAEETQTLIAVGSRGLSTPKRAANMEERMTQEKMAHLRPRFWLVARDGDHPLEMFTMGCGSAELLPVFSHVEEAEMFLDLGGAGDGWRTRESSAGEIVSLLFGLCSRVGSVALDPSPLMTPEMLDLVRVDRGRFVDLFTAPGEKKPLPRPRWVLNPGLTNRGVA